MTGLVPFAATILLGAFLLFAAEPMVAKLLLPTFGGAAEVWNTCLFVFQVLLLAGYAYAHLIREKLGRRARIAVHVALVFAGLAALPVAVPHAAGSLGSGATPVLRLLAVVVGTIGIPFFIVSTTGPVLQSWFAEVGHKQSKDPYFLYGAGNIGSLLALLAYPAVIEYTIGLAAQSQLWSWGYLTLLAMVTTCGLLAWRQRSSARGPSEITAAPAMADDREHGRPWSATITPRRRFFWLFCSFVPSSMLLAVTSYITTDVAPLPLFWTVPLAVYLTTFIIVFSGRPVLSLAITSRFLPLGATVVIYSLALEATSPAWAILPAHLFAFFLAAMVCHGQLAHDRPPAERLGEYYLVMALGGALGGLFNALIAPVIFDRLVEYPLIVIAASLCRTTPQRSTKTARSDVIFTVGLGALAAGLILTGRKLGVEPDGRLFPVLIAAPLFLNYHYLTHRLRFAGGLLAVASASVLFEGTMGHTIERQRNFYGVVRISHDATGRFVQIAHGTTLHGHQWLDPSRRRDPVGYYDRTGPVGDIFAAHRAAPAAARVGVIGLGAGGMAAYAQPGELWTFYEINPAMVRIATAGTQFTYLSDAFPQPGGYDIVLGDARLRLITATDHEYGLLILDAFASDVIPTHLLTREALSLYLQKLNAKGLMVFHISNRFVDLRAALAALADDVHLIALFKEDAADKPQDQANGKCASRWVVMSAEGAELGWLKAHGWKALALKAGTQPWTDDASNVLGSVQW